MASAHKTYLFGDFCIKAATSGRSNYAHTFGGPNDRAGVTRKDCHGKLIHLLHRFDLTDPAMPFTIPGLRWLPFYYCFDFRVSDFGYRLISDEKMITYFPSDDRNVSKVEEWPDKDYPSEFPKSSVKITAQVYDPTNIKDAYRWAGVFGIGKLSRTDQAAVKKWVKECMEGLGQEVPESEQEFNEALSSPFSQGKEDSPCLNPECANRKKRGVLTPIVLMPAEPVEGVHTFGQWGGGVQLIFRMCPKCYTIRVSNQSD